MERGLYMGNYYAAEKQTDYNSKNKKYQDVKKSLNNYINQLKIHFDLNDEEIFKIVKSVEISRRNNFLVKKWWQIWK
jgi:hemerythrin-like domain-containing protein